MLCALQLDEVESIFTRILGAHRAHYDEGSVSDDDITVAPKRKPRRKRASRRRERKRVR